MYKFVSESNSVTSFVPSLIGIPLLVSGILAMKIPEKRALWMHISATVGLLGREGATLRITVLPTTYYLIFSGIIVLILIYFFNLNDPLISKSLR